MNMQDNKEFRNVLEMIAEQVRKTPDSVAVRDGEKEITYRELWEKGGRLANYLSRENVKAGDIVGVCMSRSIEVFISVIGIMRTGAAFTLLDNYLPNDRIEYIVSDSGMSLLLVNDKDTHCNELEDVKVVDITNGCLDFCDAEYEDHICTEEDMVYILYTSGSTGRPKGVEIIHRGLENYVSWAAEYYCNNEPSGFPLYSSIGFDLTITSIFVPLVVGGTVVVFSDSDIDTIRRVVKDKTLDVIKMTPTHMNMLTENDIRECHATKFILGGEALKVIPSENVHKWSEGRIGIYNEYGPTEATVGCMIYKYDPDKDKKECVPIGKAIKNTGIFVLDKNMRPVPFNIPGEIYIGGRGLARGYRNLREQTESRFVGNPFKSGTRLYKTGDLAKVLPGKIIDYIGRIDEQVKIRGYRIELSEIENVLLNLDHIKEAAVVANDDNSKLLAFVTSGEEINEKELKAEIGKKLPPYMIPDHIMHIDEMPVTSNGKTDKSKLKRIEIKTAKHVSYETAKTKFSKELSDIWKELLKVEHVGVTDNFFDIGGNSMLIVQLAGKIEEKMNISCPVSELFAYPTIESFEKFKTGGNAQEDPEKDNEDNSRKDCDIAVIGIGARLPSGDDIDKFYELLSKETNFVRKFPFERRALINDYAKREYGEDVRYVKGAYLDDIDAFDSEFFGFSPKEADVIDPNQRLYMETCWRALEDAGYSGQTLDGTKTGVYLGYGAGENEYRRMTYLYNRDAMGSAMQGTLPAIIPSRISYLLNLHGPSVCFDTACSSSLVALHYACRDIRNNDCDQALVGSVKINLVPVDYGFDIGIASAESMTRSFDNKADGTVGGEGAIVFMIRPLEKALEAGDKIYAVIKGSAINQDGRSNGITAPNPIAQTEVIKDAWKDGGIEPESVSYIEAHGTGTKLGDPIEVLGMDGAFSRYTQKKQICAIGSVKSNMGHLDNAAGMAGMLKAVLSLKNKKFLPSANFSYPNEKIDFIRSAVYVNNEFRDWVAEQGKPRRAGVSAFGLSGTNSHVVLEEAPEVATEDLKEIDTAVLTISAKTEWALRELEAEYTKVISEAKSFDELIRICNMSNIGREHFKHRMAVLFTREGKRVVVSSTSKAEDTESLKQKADSMYRAYKAGEMSAREYYEKVLEYYVAGCDISFAHEGSVIRKVSVPHHPFKRTRHWVGIPNNVRIFREKFTKFEVNEEDKSDSGFGEMEAVILMNDDEESHRIVSEEFETSFAGINKILLNKDDVYDKLLSVDFSKVGMIVHMGGLCALDMKKSCDGLVQAVRMAVRKNDSIRVTVLTRNAYTLNGEKDNDINCESRVLLSLLRTISIEYPFTKCCGIDVDELQGIVEKMAGIAPQNYLNLVLRGGELYEAVTAYDDLDDLPERTPIVKEDGVYVIWGGTGNIGRKVAAYLAGKSRNAHIVLVGRHNVLDKDFEDKKGKYALRREQLKELMERDPGIELMCGDIRSRADVTRILSDLRDRYGKINGMFMCATDGVGTKGHPINSFDADGFMEEIGSKTEGIRILEDVITDKEQDYFVMFSSVITGTGAFGDSSYSASNSYLDAYALKGSPFAVKTITINWPTWISTVDEAFMDNMEYSQLLLPIGDDKAMSVLADIVENKNSGRYIVGEVNKNPVMVANMHRSKMKFSKEIMDEIAEKETSAFVQPNKPAEALKKVELSGNDNGKYSETEMLVASVLGNVLGYHEIDVNADFSDLGANSILMVQVQLELEKKNVYVDEADISRYSSVKALSEFIDKRSKPKTGEKTPKKVFYKNCYYNALYILLEKHGVSLYPHYANDIFCYDLKDNRIGIRTITCDDENEILKRQGVTTESRNNITLSEIKEALEQKKEIIVWIDSFYESMRQDTYEKEHLLHSIIIADYKKDSDVFIMIDHSSKDNVDYKEYEISAGELELCIEKAGSSKDESLKDCIFSFEKVNEEDTTDYGELLLDRWNEHIEEYRESAEAIGMLADYLDSRGSLDEELFGVLLSELNEIVRYKAMDVFRIKLFFGEGEILAALEEIHTEWKKFRNRLQRFKLLQEDYSSFDLKKYVDNMRKIKDKEEQLTSCLSGREMEGAS